MNTKTSNRLFIKLLLTFLAIMLIFNSFCLAQNNGKINEWGRMHGKIEQLEKIKIIELLDLNEQTTLKFFSRRDSHRDEQRRLMDKRDLLYDDLNNIFNSNDEIDYQIKINEIFNIEKEMLNSREKFFNSLKDMFSTKQIAELIVYESNFRKEMRHQFIKQGEKRKFRN